MLYLLQYNWKNFQNCSVALAERCFIVGANATGKSNFLDALRFLRDIVKKGGGLQTAVESRGGITKIRCLAARVRTDVEIEVTLREKSDAPDKWKYTLNFKHTGGGIRKNEVTVNRESVWLLTENRCLLDRTETSENETDATLKYTHLEQAVTSQQFLELRNALADIEYLNIVPQMVRESSLAPETKEDYYGRNFLSELSKLNEATRNSYLRKVNEVLKCAVPQLDNLSFVKDENGANAWTKSTSVTKFFLTTVGGGLLNADGADTSISGDENITTTYDTSDDAAAQAKYDQKMARIQVKEKQLQIDLEQIKNQQKACDTEIDSIQKIIDKNIKSAILNKGKLCFRRIKWPH